MGDNHRYGDYLRATAAKFEVVLRIYKDGDRFLLVVWRSPPFSRSKREELFAMLLWKFLPSVGARDIVLRDEPFE
jgi:hypothetical protein